MVIEWIDKDSLTDCDFCGDEVVYHFEKRGTIYGLTSTSVVCLEHACPECFERIEPSPL